MNFADRELYKFNKDNMSSMQWLTVLTGLVFANLYLLPDNNSGCTFDSTHYNRVYLTFVAIPELALRLVCFLCYRREPLHVSKRQNIINCFKIVFYTSWQLYIFLHYSKFEVYCYNPFPTFNLVVFCFAFMLTLPVTFFTVMTAFFLTLFSPCIFYALFTIYQERR